MTIRIEEVSLPKGSYNAECTLKDAWSNEELEVDLSEASESVLNLIINTLSMQVEEELKEDARQRKF